MRYTKYSFMPDIFNLLALIPLGYLMIFLAIVSPGHFSALDAFAGVFGTNLVSVLTPEFLDRVTFGVLAAPAGNIPAANLRLFGFGAVAAIAFLLCLKMAPQRFAPVAILAVILSIVSAFGLTSSLLSVLTEFYQDRNLDTLNIPFTQIYVYLISMIVFWTAATKDLNGSEEREEFRRTRLEADRERAAYELSRIDQNELREIHEILHGSRAK